jgi:predicted alpha/beta-fold hydrolase
MNPDFYPPPPSATCTACADWEDVDAYYAGSSSAKRIPAVRIPLLCIQALDDPIAPAEAIPCDAIQDNPNCMLAGELRTCQLL